MRARSTGLLALLAPIAALFMVSCATTKAPDAPAPAQPVPSPAAPAAPATPLPFALRLVDVTAAAGIGFRHENAARGAKYLPETMGSGVAIFDFDGDDRQDLLFVNFRPWPGDEAKGDAIPSAALYRNLGGWKFADVSRGSGIDAPLAGMGAAFGDMDGDGDDDLFITCLGPDHLYRNDSAEARARFVDVTQAAGLSDDDFGSSATWVDTDRDGDLDLFVANYVNWTKAGDIHCTLDGVSKSYCTPESYTGASPRLWTNDGMGRFTDTTKAAGLFDATAKALGVIAADLDGDGWQDLAVSNDTQPNDLFRAKGDGTFIEEGVMSGIAYDENGVVRAGMGIDAADYDGSGRLSLVIGNFSNEMLALYHNEGKSLFVDSAPASSVGRASLLSLGFACLFMDLDLDGHDDLLAVNGHLDSDIEKVQPQVKYAQAPLLFHNRGDGTFDEVAAQAGLEFAAPKIGRGAAHGDLDGDGDLDLVITENGGPAHVYRNDTAPGNHWLCVDARVPGTLVRVTAGGRMRASPVKGASGYLSQSASPVTFGLGSATSIEKLEVQWPGGVVTPVTVEGVDRRIEVKAPAKG